MEQTVLKASRFQHMYRVQSGRHQNAADRSSQTRHAHPLYTSSLGYLILFPVQQLLCRRQDTPKLRERIFAPTEADGTLIHTVLSELIRLTT